VGNFQNFFLSRFLGVGRPLPAAGRRRRGRFFACMAARSTMRWARPFDKTAKILGLPYPADRRWKRRRRPETPRRMICRVPAAQERQRGGRIFPFGPEDGGAPAWRKPCPCRNVSASFQRAVIDILVDRTAARWRCFRENFPRANTLVVAGVSRPIRRLGAGLARLCTQEDSISAFHRPGSAPTMRR